MDAVRQLRGKKGEPVVLSVLRDDKILSFTVVRAPVEMQEVRHFVIEDVGELSIARFTAKSVPAVRAALDDFAAAHVRAIALDLRGNYGGSFDDAVHVAELFLPSGAPIVKLERREGKEETLVSKGNPPLLSTPIVILVNQETSSSGELLAGALSEDLHSRIVGTRTFGKWTVQSVDELGNGYAIKYTTALFHTPSGKSYDGVGLTPDVEVEPPIVQKVGRAGLVHHGPDRALGGRSAAPDGALAFEAMTEPPAREVVQPGRSKGDETLPPCRDARSRGHGLHPHRVSVPRIWSGGRGAGSADPRSRRGGRRIVGVVVRAGGGGGGPGRATQRGDDVDTGS